MITALNPFVERFSARMKEVRTLKPWGGDNPFVAMHINLHPLGRGQLSKRHERRLAPHRIGSREQHVYS